MGAAFRRSAPLTGEQLEGDEAEAVDVGALGERSAGPLLGRQVRGGGRQRATVGAASDPHGDPEVGEVRVAVVVDQDVRRLDVAVDDAVPVGVASAPPSWSSRRRRGSGSSGPRSRAARSEPPRIQRITR